MPTFDFSNIIKKLVSTAIQVSCSPVTWVLAAATALSVSVSYLTDWFNSITIPQLSVDNSLIFNSDILKLLLYLVNFDTLLDILISIVNFITSAINFLIRFVISLFSVLIPVIVQSVIRKSLKDWQ